MAAKSIVHAAEDIFNSMRSGKSTIPHPAVASPPNAPATTTAYVPDIRSVSMDNNYSNAILEQAFGIKTNKPTKKVESKQPVAKKSLNDLVEEFAKVVSRAKELIQEMTTCGMIGVGKVKPLGNKKKLIRKSIK
ncbi:MAG: hypothetical protein WC648_04935 [Candidatus Paceibacterota bacterium]